MEGIIIQITKATTSKMNRGKAARNKLTKSTSGPAMPLTTYMFIPTGGVIKPI